MANRVLTALDTARFLYQSAVSSPFKYAAHCPSVVNSVVKLLCAFAITSWIVSLTYNSFNGIKRTTQTRNSTQQCSMSIYLVLSHDLHTTRRGEALRTTKFKVLLGCCVWSYRLQTHSAFADSGSLWSSVAAGERWLDEDSVPPTSPRRSSIMSLGLSKEGFKQWPWFPETSLLRSSSPSPSRLPPSGFCTSTIPLRRVPLTSSLVRQCNRTKRRDHKGQ